MRYRYDEPPVPHGMTPFNESSVFLLEATQGKPKDGQCGSYICHSFIVSADTADQAILMLKSNAQAVIDEVKKRLNPEDMVEQELFMEPSLQDNAKAREIRESIDKLQDQYDNLSGETDLDDDMRQEVAGRINEYRERLKDLAKLKPCGKESNFTSTCRRMLYILADNTEIEATKIDNNRCIPVAYFDDGRSIIGSWPQ